MSLPSAWRDSIERLRLPSLLASPTARPHLILLVIVVAGLGFYAPTVGYWFFNDDFWFLHASRSTPAGSYIVGAFNFHHQQYVPPLLYRPLCVVLFKGLYQVFGLHAWAYHLFGLSLHLANGALLWLIAIKLTRRPMAAHLAALIFLLHPSYALAVVFIANNLAAAVVSTFAFLSCLWLFFIHCGGGPRSRVYYVGSLLAFVSALLLHPETSYIVAVLPLSYALVLAENLAELRSVRAWAQFVPFFLVAAGFFVVQNMARNSSSYQSESFELGRHMFDNYVRYIALALDPYRVHASKSPFDLDQQALSHWRTLLPVASGLAAALALLFFERRRPRAGTFALLWFLMAVLPLSTWTLGTESRKLYGAGAGLALAIAIFAVSAWDFVPARLQPGLRSLVPAHLVFLLVAIAMGIRVVQLTDPFGQASEDFRTMVQEVRDAYPTLPDGSRLYLSGVPWPMIIYGPDSVGLASALRIYYGEIEIATVSSPDQLAKLPNPPTPTDVVFQYRCPPVCQPPVP